MQNLGLLETIKISKSTNGYEIYFLDKHLARLYASAKYLGLKYDDKEINADNFPKSFFLDKICQTLESQSIKEIDDFSWKVAEVQESYRCRLVFFFRAANKNLSYKIQVLPLKKTNKEFWQIKCLKAEDFHIDSQDTMHQHKYFPRMDLSKFFELKSKAPLDDVIWLNDKNQICEGSRANIFWSKDDLTHLDVQELFQADTIWHTPTLESCILPGIIRGVLLERFPNKIKSASYTIEDLAQAKSIIMTNSLTEIAKAQLLN